MDTSQYQVGSGVTLHSIVYVCQPCDLAGRPPLHSGDSPLSLHDLLALATRHDAERHSVDLDLSGLVPGGSCRS
jgi:hypothetical protein